MNKNFQFISLITLSTFFFACSSGVKKAEIPKTADLQTEIASLEDSINKGITEHADLLAHDEFTKAEKQLAEAKDDFKTNQSRDEILDDLAYGQAYIKIAREKSENKTASVESLIKAREAAIVGGVYSSPELRQELISVDDRVRYHTDNFKNTVTAEKYSELQRSYLGLELKAIQNQKLAGIRRMVENAKDKNAQRIAPRTYKEASVALKVAENEIMANRHDSAVYQPAVDKAQRKALTLTEAVRLIRESKKGSMSEPTALRIIEQNRTISSLQENLNESESELSSINKNYQAQSIAFTDSEKKVRMQQALDQTRKQFSPDEAQVFQEGDKLMIRLKKINFASGDSTIPHSAMPLLEKAKNVAEGLNPSEIVVEGHTDSTGSANINRDLSESRAQAVADYLGSDWKKEVRIQAVGLGYDQPLSTNKTKNGRAQNRRVDLIITPSTASSQVPNTDAGKTNE